MRFSLFFLFLFSEFAFCSFANLVQQRKLCSNRCHRLLKRSLERIGQAGTAEEILYRTNAYSRHQLLASLQQNGASSVAAPFESPLPEPLLSICWKFFDFEDCSRQCEKAFLRRKKRKNGQKTPEEEETKWPIGQEQSEVLQFCHRHNLSVPRTHFSCIHKFHAFVEVRCSSYQQKAVQLRLMAYQIRQQMPPTGDGNSDGRPHHLPNAIDQEVCLLLHQHSACLGNALGHHCPSARSLFASRHALRDNFLSFVLPFGTAMERKTDERNAKQSDAADLNDGTIELDQLFSDEILDLCQLLDFNRILAQWQEDKRDGEMPTDGQQKTTRDSIRRPTTKRAVGTMPTTTERAEGQRRVFSSDEDLLDIPPNFHFSSARLPPDFYTRYAIWWGGRSRPAAAHSTIVQLLPDTAPKPADVSKWPYTTTTTEVPPVTATRTTWPDALLTTKLPDEHETVLMQEPSVEMLRTSDSRPYLINGHITVPNAQWDTVPDAVTKRTEIRLLTDDSHRLQSSAPTSGGTAPTTNWPRQNAKETDKLAQLRTDANNVYFAKILQFDEEDNSGEGRDGTETPPGGRVTAYIEHIPREQQLSPMPKQNGTEIRRHSVETDDSYAEENYSEDDRPSDEDEEGWDEDENWSEEGDDFPYRISTAARPTSSGWPRVTPSTSAARRAGGGGRGLADLSPKSRVHHPAAHPPPTSNGDRIVVTAEPVPGTHSDVLLVLLGLYGTFFGIAAFLLLCLLLACLERRRRRHGLLGRYRRKYCLKNLNDKKGGSAILYIDERLGTVKSVVGK